MAECFLSNLSIFYISPREGTSFYGAMLTRDADSRQLSPDPDPKRKAATNDDIVAGVCECACVHMCTVHAC